MLDVGLEMSSPLLLSLISVLGDCSTSPSWMSLHVVVKMVRGAGTVGTMMWEREWLVMSTHSRAALKTSVTFTFYLLVDEPPHEQSNGSPLLWDHPLSFAFCIFDAPSQPVSLFASLMYSFGGCSSLPRISTLLVEDTETEKWCNT